MQVSQIVLIFTLFIAIFLAGCIGTPGVEKPTTQQIPVPVDITNDNASTQSPIKTASPETTTEQPVSNDAEINGLDTKKSVVMGPYVFGGVKNISPMYSELRDDFATKDYEKMATDSQKIKRFVENELENIGFDERSATNEFMEKLSTKDTMIYKKYEGYLNKLKELSESIQIPLSWIRDDPSKVGLGDKLDSFSTTFAIAKETKDQFESMMESCDEYGADCGQNLTEAKELKKLITFF